LSPRSGERLTVRFDTGVLAGLLIGLAWLVIGLVTLLVLRRRHSQGAVIGIFLMVVGALTLFATLLLAVVPGAPA
jgi:drug/metabolite transporter (DMT)-like permease